MIASNNSYICADNQTPCSSNAYSYGAMYPNSNHTIPTPESNYAPSPQSHSRTMTPNHYSQPSFKQEHTQMWLQSHDRGGSGSCGNPSPAPSVMSTMTHLSGLSAITVNTQITNMSQMSNFNNNFNSQHGPLSSNSHSENVDPKSDLYSHAESLLESLSEPDPEIKSKTIHLLDVVLQRLKQSRNAPDLLIQKILKKTIFALHLEKIDGIQIQLSNIINKICNLFLGVCVNIIKKERQIGFLKDLFSFYNCVEENNNNQTPRFLRYLFPALYFLFNCAQTEMEVVRLGKNSKLGVFLMKNLFLFYDKAVNCNNVGMYWAEVKYIGYYFNVLRMLLKRNEPLRVKVLNMNIIKLILDVTCRNIDCFHSNPSDSSASQIIRACHSAIIKTVENLITSKIEILPDELIKHNTIQILLTATIIFNQILSPSTVYRTYVSLAQIAHSKEIVKMNPQTYKVNYGLAFVINRDLSNSLQKTETNVVVEISKFLCNMVRNDQFKIDFLSNGFFETVLLCLEKYLPNAADAKRVTIQDTQFTFHEFYDNFLFTLLQLCNTKIPQLRELFFTKLASPPVCELFFRIINKNQSLFILRILRIWKNLLYVNIILDASMIVPYLLQCLKNFWYKNPLSKDDISLLKAITEILKIFASAGIYKPAIIHHISPSDLMKFLNEQENVELISAMLSLIFDLWQHCVELRHFGFSGPEMRSLLERFANSNSLELSNLAQTMLTQVGNDVDDFVPPLAGAFNTQGNNFMM